MLLVEQYQVCFTSGLIRFEILELERMVSNQIIVFVNVVERVFLDVVSEVEFVVFGWTICLFSQFDTCLEIEELDLVIWAEEN